MRVADRSETVPNRVQSQIHDQLGDLETLLSRYPYLPGVVKAISDHFQTAEQRTTPWAKDGAFHAYLAYFHTLNTVRFTSALRHLHQAIGDHEIKSVLDFGSGLGAAEMAFTNVFRDQSPSWVFVEAETQVATWHQKILEDKSQKSWAPKVSSTQAPVDLFLSCYALNELGFLPDYALTCKHIVIVEPSIRDHSRRLMTLRAQLMENGFQLLAPCTHALECPLLKHSKQDFCHDRIHFQAPEWFAKLEAELPMKNQTLTFSYLVASRSLKVSPQPGLARVIGDTLKEKGKSRQALCRNDDREFLSWLKRHGDPQYLPHGSLVQLPEGLEKKGHELRCDPELPIVIV